MAIKQSPLGKKSHLEDSVSMARLEEMLWVHSYLYGGHMNGGRSQFAIIKKRLFLLQNYLFRCEPCMCCARAFILPPSFGIYQSMISSPGGTRKSIVCNMIFVLAFHLWPGSLFSLFLYIWTQWCIGLPSRNHNNAYPFSPWSEIKQPPYN